MEILITILVTWFLVYNLFYSPRAQIRKLSRQMFNIPIKLARAKKKLGDENNILYDACKKSLEVRHKAIIALLDLYFDTKNDKEFIEEKTNCARALLNNVDSIFNK